MANKKIACIEKLSGVSLENVCGGHWMNTASAVGFVTGAMGAVGTVGCEIASLVLKRQAKEAEKAGDLEKSKEKNAVAYDLHKASWICSGITASGLGAGMGFRLWARYTDAQHRYDSLLN